MSALWLFLIYSFFGWCVEVMYFAFETGKFVNRGYLAGPACPIYGFGVLGVLYLLTPLKSNLAVLFAGSVIITTLLELVTGFLMEKILHDKWWDYSNKPFNFHGYICIEFSVIWGVACVLVVDVVHPLVSKLLPLLTTRIGGIALIVLLAVFAADFVITTVGVAHFSKFVRAARDIETGLGRLSDGIGEKLADGVFSFEERQEKFREGERERRMRRHERFKTFSGRIASRLSRAFPTLDNEKNRRFFENLRKK